MKEETSFLTYQNAHHDYAPKRELQKKSRILPLKQILLGSIFGLFTIFVMLLSFNTACTPITPCCNYGATDVQVDTIRILFLGASMVSHWEMEGSDALQKLQQQPNVECIIDGVPGCPVSELYEGLLSYGLQCDTPDIIVFHIGLNDIGRGMSPEAACALQSKTVERLHLLAPEATLIVMGMNHTRFEDPCNRLITENNALLKKNVEQRNNSRIIYMDLNHRLDDASGNILPEYLKDSVHFTPKGYEVWLEEMLRVLKGKSNET